MVAIKQTTVGEGSEARLVEGGGAADHVGAEHPAEHLIVGGGLAGGLIALALAEAGRGAGVVLVEQDAGVGGNHTWSFHLTDLDQEEWRLIAPLVTSQWPRQVVRFPGRHRVIEAGYASIASADFARVVRSRLEAAGAQILLGRRVAAVGGTLVRLEDETILRGRVVIDARGPGPADAEGRSGYQKFLGLELQLASDGPWAEPLVMDATVPQMDGYRFMYVLPFSPRRVLIEDTRYSGNPHLDAADLERRVLDYAHLHGVTVSAIVRRESGVLPLPLRAAPVAAGVRSPGQGWASPLTVGYRGGFFHPVTGYSLPCAARVALAVAGARTAEEASRAVGRVARRLEGQRRFQRLLNRLMFDAMPPASRWTALERFYRFPDATIARFYASRNTLWDRFRLLAGRPPRGLSWRRLFRTPVEES